jgi:hypothetical protein
MVIEITNWTFLSWFVQVQSTLHFSFLDYICSHEVFFFEMVNWKVADARERQKT